MTAINRSIYRRHFPAIKLRDHKLFQALCALQMANKAVVNISLPRALLYTVGLQVLPASIPDLTLLTGSGLNITDVLIDNRVRDFPVCGVPLMSSAPPPLPEVTRQTSNTTSTASRASLAVRLNSLDMFRSKNLARHSIAVYAADLSTLLLLCGDIEANPGPTAKDVEPLTQTHQQARVGIEKWDIPSNCIRFNY